MRLILFALTLEVAAAAWVSLINSGSRDWRSIAMSSDGTKLAAGTHNGYIYTSTDGGNTWTARTGAGSRYWYSIAMSSDGTKLAAVVSGGYIYTSTDGGDSWTSRIGAGNRYWSSIAMSSDGTRLLAGAIYQNPYGADLQYSTDSGIVWQQAPTPYVLNIYGLAISDKGDLGFALQQSWYILKSGCPAGSYLASWNNQCYQCSTGSYQSQETSLAGNTPAYCTGCGPGEFQNLTGQSFCYLCNPGEYQYSYNAQSCYQCNPSTYQSQRGQQSCDMCQLGTEQPLYGQSSCSLCSPGSFSSYSWMGCQPCSAGTYQDEYGQGSCKSCPCQTASGKDYCLPCLNVPSYAYIIASVVVPVFYVAGLMCSVPWIGGGYNINSVLSLLTITIIPVLDSTTDLLFMLMSVFGNRALMIAMMVFYFLPMLHFFVWLNRRNSLIPRLALLVRSSQSLFDVKKNNAQSFFSAFLLLILNTLDIVITLLWCVIGVFMYTFKMFIISAYQAKWLSVWTGSNKDDEDLSSVEEDVVEDAVDNLSAVVDMSAFNESVYVSAILGSTPQLIIQSMSCQMTGEWTAISIVSVICSFMNIVYSVYRFITNFHIKNDVAIPGTKEEFKHGLENVLGEINTLSISQIKTKLHHLCVDRSISENKLSLPQTAASLTTKPLSQDDDQEGGKKHKTSKYKKSPAALDEFNGAPLSI